MTEELRTYQNMGELFSMQMAARHYAKQAILGHELPMGKQLTNSELHARASFSMSYQIDREDALNLRTTLAPMTRHYNGPLTQDMFPSVSTMAGKYDHLLYGSQRIAMRLKHESHEGALLYMLLRCQQDFAGTELLKTLVNNLGEAIADLSYFGRNYALAGKRHIELDEGKLYVYYASGLNLVFELES